MLLSLPPGLRELPGATCFLEQLDQLQGLASAPGGGGVFFVEILHFRNFGKDGEIATVTVERRGAG